MSKGKRRTGDWSLAERLHKASLLLDPLSQSKAKSLLEWHSRTGKLSEKQRIFANGLINRAHSSRKPKAKGPVPHFLYAMSDGVNVKLGFSRNPEARRKDIQTGQSMPLALIWTLPAGDSAAKAMVAERKLHRFCAKFKKRGEWYSLDCMTLVKQFEIYEKAKKENDAKQPKEFGADETTELSILNEARARI